MSFFKCKMCGGTIEFEKGATVGICDSCGTKQTLPRLDDDKKANLYDRANHFRRNNEYDKAMSIYEQILAEDNTDAEAYWSLVLCRYGIEYVEDPATGKRIPTVNRAQFTSVFDDDNYKSALRCADAAQKEIYQAEAKAINEIQKGILAISQKEEPFDVFICYKETDSRGARTPDSVLANDLYHQLTQEGFKVFFSRITLEDKLGSAYEPYIFAALNSAKVMVVLGTRPEYFNAVWVKNEWSRYLALIKNGAKKMLIPAYKDMDPYDLPEEFSHLQAQDMGKLGFMQDLIRGIKKIVASGEQKPAPAAKPAAPAAASSTGAAPLLQRAFLFLEDENWGNASDYFGKVLDKEPTNAQAYLGKLLALMKVTKLNSLADCDQLFDRDNNCNYYYSKVLRFGDEKLKKQIQGYLKICHGNAAISNYDHHDRDLDKYFFNTYKTIDCFGIAMKCYDEAIKIFESVSDLSAVNICKYKKAKVFMTCGDRSINDKAAIDFFEEAIKILESLPDSFDADEFASEYDDDYDNYDDDDDDDDDDSDHYYYNNDIDFCKKKIEYWRQYSTNKPIWDKAYALKDKADTLQKNGKKRSYEKAVECYKEAIKIFESLDDWDNADSYVSHCESRIEECQSKETERRKAARKRNIRRIITLSVIVCIALAIVVKTVFIPALNYRSAVKLLDNGEIIDAYEGFIALNGYKDSAQKAAEIFDEYKPAKLKAADVGDTVFFGAYEQDKDTANGKEAIAWLVLAKEDNKLFLISEKALDCVKYNNSDSDVTWRNCYLRSWLNDTFMDSAFSADEQDKIQSTNVSADKNPSYDTKPGKATTDKVFLLSVDEVNKYFGDKSTDCIPTDYAISKGVSVKTKFLDFSSTEYCFYWWLRTPGKYQTYATYASTGSIDYNELYGSHVNSSYHAVRPALWISIE